jgi:PilZ domain
MSAFRAAAGARPPSPPVLLVDDGELDEIAELLDALGVAHVRLRGGEIGETVEPPLELLVTTPRRARAVRRVASAATRAGRPVRMVLAEEDSPALRYMLRELGFHLLVRGGTPPGVLRLLVLRALFQGSEQRAEPRVPASEPIGVLEGDSPGRAILMDISNRGCRFLADRGIASGARVLLEVPTAELDGEPLRLPGRVVRSSAEDRDVYTAAVLFDEHLDAASRRRLARLLNTLSRGAGSLHAEEDPSSTDFLPPRPSPAFPGLTLDAETDPPLAADLEMAVTVASAAGPERRRHPRGAFPQKVVARGDEGRRVLMGRDLSREGMRVERLDELDLGDRLRLSLFAPGRAEPFLVEAVVARDDGERGLALRFENLGSEVGEAIERLVAGLPDLEALEEGEAANLGRVISEILPNEPGGRLR